MSVGQRALASSYAESHERWGRQTFHGEHVLNDRGHLLRVEELWPRIIT